MPLIPVDDPADPRLSAYRSLKATNETRGLPLFVVEGEKLVDWLLSSRYPVESIVCREETAERMTRRVDPGTPIYVMNGSKIGGLVGYNFHQGALACGRRVPGPGLDDLLAGSGAGTTIVVAPVVHNPENLGSIIRTADVFGVAAVLVGEGSADFLSRRVLRVSMGTALRMPVIVASDLAGAVERCRAVHGFSFVATVTDPEAVSLDGFRRPDRLGVVLGSEAHGLSADWVSRCDSTLTIPMRPGAESLNVAIAAGILLHALTFRSNA